MLNNIKQKLLYIDIFKKQGNFTPLSSLKFLFCKIVRDYYVFQMNQPRNKFIDRFRTQIIKPSQNNSGQKTSRLMQANSSTNIRSINSKKSNSKSIDIHDIIVKNLQKHINYLEKKLKDSQQECERVKNLLDQAQKKIVENDVEHQGLIDQIEELNQCICQTQKNYDIAKSDYQNLVLKQIMEKLSGQVNQKRQAFARLELKHQQYKKGRFSAAFLPSSFGSPVKYKEKNSKEFSSIIKEYQLKNIKEQAALTKQSMENDILAEYKKIKLENESLRLQIRQTKVKNEMLQLQMQNLKNIEKQKDSLSQQLQELSKQIIQLNHKIENLANENKRFLNKISENQQKMIQISMAINQRSLSVSSLKQNSNIKIQQQMQTESYFNPEIRQNNDNKKLQERIYMLTRKLQEKDKQVKKQKEQYKEQVNDLFDLMKKCNDQNDGIDQEFKQQFQEHIRNMGKEQINQPQNQIQSRSLDINLKKQQQALKNKINFNQ